MLRLPRFFQFILSRIVLPARWIRIFTCNSVSTSTAIVYWSIAAQTISSLWPRFDYHFSIRTSNFFFLTFEFWIKYHRSIQTPTGKKIPTPGNRVCVFFLVTETASQHDDRVAARWTAFGGQRPTHSSFTRVARVIDDFRAKCTAMIANRKHFALCLRFTRGWYSKWISGPLHSIETCWWRISFGRLP